MHFPQNLKNLKINQRAPLPLSLLVAWCVRLPHAPVPCLSLVISVRKKLKAWSFLTDGSLSGREGTGRGWGLPRGEILAV